VGVISSIHKMRTSRYRLGTSDFELGTYATAIIDTTSKISCHSVSMLSDLIGSVISTFATCTSWRELARTVSCRFYIHRKSIPLSYTLL